MNLMKIKRGCLGIVTFLIASINLVAANIELYSELREALCHAGGNRGELEAGLRKAKGNDTEFLIAHSSQYDLVNMTVQQVVEDVTYARKVHDALPYLGEMVDDELWREWVLPHRVLNEDLCLWRKDFYERMQLVVKGKSTTKAAVDAIHTWLMVPNETGVARVGLADAENRPKTPSQVLKFGGGTCGELSMLFVYLLRSVGIPARHCMMSWKYNLNDRHFYCEYWDAQLHRWITQSPTPLQSPISRSWAVSASATTP